jgi:hypothetical protein
MDKKINLKIGGIKISISYNRPKDIIYLRGYRRFLLNSLQEKADINLEIIYSGLPAFNLTDKKSVFKNNNGAWELYYINKKIVFLLKYPDFLIKRLCLRKPQTFPYYKIAIVNRNFDKVVIYRENGYKVFVRCKDRFIYRDKLIGSIEDILPVITSGFLCLNKRGILFHAAGVIDKGNGYLFVGSPGKGKTTIAKLFKENNATILNDDKIIVSKNNGDFWLYGTPWHGRCYTHSSCGVRLKRIFFIEHGIRNAIYYKKPSSDISLLFRHSHFPVWDKTATENTLDFCSQLSREIPMAELTFVPDRGIANFIRKNIR